MHKSILNITACVAVSFALFYLPGCGKAAEVTVEKMAEKAIEAETGGDAQVDIKSDDGTFTMTAGDGENTVNVQAGESVSLPDDLPGDIPLPSGVTWNMVQNTTGPQGNLVLQGTLATPMADVAAALKTEAEAQGWESVQNISQVGALEMMTYSKGEKTLTYNLASDDEKTTIMVASG
jgi:hypothetical protein